jgi:hypothetical protein
MTSLQIGLILAGVALVVGVLVYNWVQERRVRRRIRAAFRDSGKDSPAAAAPQSSAPRGENRIEPTLGTAPARDVPVDPVAAAPAPEEGGFEPPLAVQARIATSLADDAPTHPVAAALGPARTGGAEPVLHGPDADIECVVTLQPARPVTAGAVAAGLHARLGKPLRWFGRRGPDLPWQELKSETTGQFTEIAACLLLADRSGAAVREVIDAFVRLAASVASSLPAAFAPPDAGAEAARAEALNRICADLDVQIGLTVLKPGPATIPGTRLRGVAEAAGFRLAEGGRFDWIPEETGAVAFSLANFRPEPFTAEMLRVATTQGVVFLLDVPRVADPARTFDQMKLAAKRMAQTLDAVLVDDNRRPLDDAALASIRGHVQATAAALSEVNIEPGSARALALFGD